MNPEKEREQELSFLRIEEPMDSTLILHSENVGRISHGFTIALKKHGIPVYEREETGNEFLKEAFLFRSNYAPFVLYFYQKSDFPLKPDQDLTSPVGIKGKKILILLGTKEKDIHGNRLHPEHDFYRIYRVSTPLERKKLIRELSDLILSSYPYKEKYGSLVELKKKADKGENKACYYLGKKYLTFPRSEEEKKQAFEYIRKASDNGDSKAKVELPLLYLLGIGTEKDTKKGLSLLDEIEFQEQDKDYYRLSGEIYDFGLGVEGDDYKAIYYYEHAIRYGDEYSYLPLSQLYSFTDQKEKEKNVLLESYYQHRIGSIYPLSEITFDDPDDRKNEKLRLLRLGKYCLEKNCLYELASRIYKKNKENYTEEW